MDFKKRRSGEQQSWFTGLLPLLGLSVAVAYVVLGFLIYFMPQWFMELSQTRRTLFASLLVAYGTFRLYRFYRERRDQDY